MSRWWQAGWGSGPSWEDSQEASVIIQWGDAKSQNPVHTKGIWRKSGQLKEEEEILVD